jgi:hypothetical protein
MKAKWEANDYDQMAWRPLAFTEEDVRLIYLGFATRPSRRAATQGSR